MYPNQIRAPRAEDRVDWLRMRRLLWPDCSDEEHETDIQTFLARDDSSPPASCGYSTGDVAAFVAERECGLCGFVEASIRPYADGADSKPVGYIEGWYVDVDLRRQGVGRALVEAAESWARSKGCRQMASDAHLWNTLSHESHLALGYEETCRLVLFKKDLD